VTAQMELPFLTVDQAATIDAARAAIDRFQGAAIAARRWHDADELGRIGTKLVEILDANMRRHPTHRPPPTSTAMGDRASQEVPTAELRRPEPTQ
jgi:hypothetical protein